MEFAGERLRLCDLPPGVLEKIEAQGYGLIWTQQGQKRKIPQHVLLDVLRVYRDGQKFLGPDRLGALLDQAHGFDWGQGEETL